VGPSGSRSSDFGERARGTLHWLLNDDRPFELKGEHYVVAGIEERLSFNLHRPAYTPAEASYPFLKSMPGGEEPPAIDFAVKARAARN